MSISEAGLGAGGDGVAYCHRRRRWSEAQKRQIVAETRAPGVSVAMVAQRYKVNANQVFKWRRRFCAPASAAGSGRLVPVVVEGTPGHGSDAGASGSRSGDEVDEVAVGAPAGGRIGFAPGAMSARGQLDVDALKTALAASEARAAAAEAKASDAEARVAALTLMIEKLRRALYGARSERKERLLHQLELTLDELAASATEDELAPGTARQTPSPAHSRLPPRRSAPALRPRRPSSRPPTPRLQP